MAVRFEDVQQVTFSMSTSDVCTLLAFCRFVPSVGLSLCVFFDMSLKRVETIHRHTEVTPSQAYAWSQTYPAVDVKQPIIIARV